MDGVIETEVRKRRIVKRIPMASASAPLSQQTLVDAGTLLRLDKGEQLIGQGESAVAIAMVGMGRLRLTRALSDGRPLALGYRSLGEIVGESALGGASLYRETAVATEDVEALMVPVPTFRALFAADHGFGSGLLSVLVERHGDIEERLASMLFHKVEARLADFLVRAAARWGIATPRGVLIAAPFTHQEIADMIGSTRETVTLHLGTLREENVIEIERRRIVVLDRAALKSRVGARGVAALLAPPGGGAS